MHACLAIPEIVAAICEKAQETEPQQKRCQLLLALALTCNDFQYFAMNVLWRKQPNGLLNLLKCLPSDAWELRPCRPRKKERHTEFHITRELSREDWKRPRLYSRFIQDLSLSDGGPVGVADEGDTFPLLAQSLGALDSPLLPNLLTVDIQDDRSMIASLLKVCVGRRLGSLSVACYFEQALGDGPDELFTLASDIVHKSPELRLIRIQSRVEGGLGENRREQVSRCITRAIRSSHYLQEVILGEQLDAEGILHLYNLKNLRHLRLHRPLDALPEVLASSLDITQTPGFTSLEKLIVHVRTLSQPTILDLMQSSPLSRINVTVYEPQSPSAYGAFFASSLKNSCRTNTVTYLCIVEHSNHRIVHDMSSMSSDLLPLLEFTGLQDLSIRVTSPYTVDDEFLSRAASAWRNLRSLHLMSDTQPALQIPPAATIGGLIPIAQNCPHLLKLALIFDARHVPLITPELKQYMMHNRTSVEIFLGNSPLEHSERVAKFLTSIFWDVDIFSWTSNWRDVQVVLSRTRFKRVKDEALDIGPKKHNPLRQIMWAPRHR